MQPPKNNSKELPPSHLYPARYPQTLKEPPGKEELKKMEDLEEEMEEEIEDSLPEEPAPPGEGP